MVEATEVLKLTRLISLKGFKADNPNIALLRLRNYTVGKKLKDEEVLGERALGRMTELIGILAPFVSFSEMSSIHSRRTGLLIGHGV